MVKMVDLVGLQVDLGGFAPNVCNVVTALSLETAFMPGGNPAVAATHLFILLLWNLRVSLLRNVHFYLLHSKKRVVWWSSSSAGLKFPPALKAVWAVGPFTLCRVFRSVRLETSRSGKLPREYP